MSEELTWPRPGDVLFAEGEDWLNNACVGWTSDQWVGYTEGYRRAANILVDHIADSWRGQDYLVHPIVYLFRQAIEVSLKHLIWVGVQLNDREPTVPMHHDLVRLWKECRQLIGEVWPEGPKQDLNVVDSVLREFGKRDPKSTTFRYPVTKDGQPSLTQSERINLRNFANVANGVLSLLEGCGCGFREYLQYKWEREREYPE